MPTCITDRVCACVFLYVDLSAMLCVLGFTYGPRDGKSMQLFIDDLNLCETNASCNQPANEVKSTLLLLSIPVIVSCLSAATSNLGPEWILLYNDDWATEGSDRYYSDGWCTHCNLHYSASAT